jgi:hypothetical protein
VRGNRNGVRILSICDDEGLSLSREILLSKSGYETESATSHDLLAVGYVRSFDIALICHSVDQGRQAMLSEMLCRYNPRIQMLRIEDLQIASELLFGWGMHSAGPLQLLEAVRSMCDRVQMSAIQPNAMIGKKPPRSAVGRFPLEKHNVGGFQQR